MDTVLFEQPIEVSSEKAKAALDIYIDAFPCNERHPLDVIAERVQQGSNILYTGTLLHGEVVFMALIWPLQCPGFILLDYIATHRDYRNKKIAASFLQDYRAVKQFRIC